jgi:hypothetical protein
MLAGGLLFLVWAISFAVHIASLLIESSRLAAAPEGDLGCWWVFAAVGAPLAVLGLCFYFIALRELRNLKPD